MGTEMDEDALIRWWSLELAEIALIETKPVASRRIPAFHDGGEG